MTCDIFIKTYLRDKEWLNYCLRSIAKYASGFEKVIVCVPESEFQSYNHLTLEKVVLHKTISKNGYIDQQAQKLHADQWCDSDLICFVDSDCCFTRRFSPADLVQNNKPIIYQTKYENAGNAKCWQRCTQDVVLHHVPWEYMRRLPITYHRNSLIEFRNWFRKNHSITIDDMLSKSEKFSEFNALGAWCSMYEPGLYRWVDTDSCALPQPLCLQGWSWGGLTQENKNQMENALK